MLSITRNISIPDSEIEIVAVRAGGAGGQNVNKVSSAVHLRFSIPDSSLPGRLKQRLLAMSDQRISREGTVVIKAQQHRTQEQNRRDALDRLRQMIASALHVTKKRKPTKPSLASRKKRLQNKRHRSRVKSLRGKVDES